MEIGRIVNGRYLLTDILGKGGMGTVYLAENIKLGTQWAIKCIREDLDDTGSGCIRREAEILKKLEHPALPRIFDVFEEGNYTCIVADYINGANLSEYMISKGIPDESEVLQWLRQLCAVLDYLHTQEPEPVIYRDMKPSNIILTKDNKIKLVDFGIARRYKEENLYDTVFIGTKGYAAPEQYGAGQTDARTDIYGLGMTLYHMLSGVRPDSLPEDVPPLGNYNHTISSGMENIISRCIRKDREKRYVSAAELLNDVIVLEGERKPEIYKGYIRKRKNDNTMVRLTVKRLVVCICGNPEFASEFAYTAANMTWLDVLLIDAGTEYQLTARYLNAAATNEDNYSTGKLVDSAEGGAGRKGCIQLIELIKEGKSGRDILEGSCYKTQTGGRLHILAGPPEMSAIPGNEGVSRDGMGRIIDHAYRYYDLTVVSIDFRLDCPLPLWIFDRADYIIFAPAANEECVYCCSCQIAYCLRNFKNEQVRLKVALFNYSEGTSIPFGKVKKIFGKMCLPYFIGYNSENERSKNHGGYCSKSRFEKRSEEYLHILEYFNLFNPKFPMRTFTATASKIGKYFRSLFSHFIFLFIKQGG